MDLMIQHGILGQETDFIRFYIFFWAQGLGAQNWFLRSKDMSFYDKVGPGGIENFIAGGLDPEQPDGDVETC
jgi:hypothetical protein